MQLRKDTWSWMVRAENGTVLSSGHKKRRLASRAAQALVDKGWQKKLYLVNESNSDVMDFKPYPKDTFNQKQKKEEARVLPVTAGLNPGAQGVHGQDVQGP